MVRIATENDFVTIALMMRDMYQELMPDDAVDDPRAYLYEVIRHNHSSKDTIYVDDESRGFFIVRDETEPMAPTLHRYNGIRVYIRPEHRHGSLLARFYKQLFKDFPDGDILGVTEIESQHIKVLDKRHTLIAKVYKLNRS